MTSLLLPDTADAFLGQSHLMGRNAPLRSFLERKTFRSMVIHGPPGCGKSSFVQLVERLLPFHFQIVRGAEGTAADLKKAIDLGRNYLRSGQKTILVIEEIDRFTRTQQDVLVPALERGDILLLGLSYDNPIRSLLPPLVSRVLIFLFYPLSPENLASLLERARLFLANEKKVRIEIDRAAQTLLVRRAGGDGRKLLLVFEAIVTAFGNSSGTLEIGLEQVARFEGSSGGLGRDPDTHYDLISAFIKSVRNHDPDASIHYLARMIETGEDPLFVARRLVVLASEDIGLANPAALPVAVSCLEAIRSIGMPEGRIPLAQTTLYLALSPKSNSAYKAIDRSLKEVREGFLPPVPEFLKNVHLPDTAPGQEGLQGGSYRYPPDEPSGVSPQRYFSGKGLLYSPPLHPNGEEAEMVRRLLGWLRAKGWAPPSGLADSEDLSEKDRVE
ncbi:MAG: AAA family ATPase [Leptospirales bacterium]